MEYGKKSIKLNGNTYAIKVKTLVIAGVFIPSNTFTPVTGDSARAVLDIMMEKLDYLRKNNNSGLKSTFVELIGKRLYLRDILL